MVELTRVFPLDASANCLWVPRWVGEDRDRSCTVPGLVSNAGDAGSFFHHVMVLNDRTGVPLHCVVDRGVIQSHWYPSTNRRRF